MTDNELLKLITDKQEPEYQFVRRLAAEHNADLHRWCRHRRTMYRLVTDTTISVSLMVLVIVTLLPKPDGHYISDAQARTETLNNIDQTLLASL